MNQISLCRFNWGAMEVVILIGLQASGKTSFCRDRFSGSHDVISKDRFRNARNPQKRQMRMLEEALQRERSVVIDNTNATREDRAAIIAAAKAAQASVVGYYFESRVEESVRRNRSRKGSARVPDVAIYSTIKRLEKPRTDEGFDRLHFVRLTEGGTFEVQEWKEDTP